jgi:hypothetical protein
VHYQRPGERTTVDGLPSGPTLSLNLVFGPETRLVKQLIPERQVYPEAWWRTVRITVSHDRSREEVKEAVDRSFDDMLKAILILPIQLIQMHRAWQGNTLTFSLVARKGLLRTPIKGTVEITDRDITFDIVLGFLERLIPAAKARQVLTNRVRGLLK